MTSPSFQDLLNQANSFSPDGTSPQQNDFNSLLNEGNALGDFSGGVSASQPKKKEEPKKPSFLRQYINQESRITNKLGQGVIEGVADIINIPKNIQNVANKLGAKRSVAATPIGDTFGQISDKIREFSRKLAPIDKPEDETLLDKTAFTVGKMIGTAPVYLGGTKLAAKGVSMLPTALRSRAAQAVVRAVESTGLSAPAVTKVAAGISALPQELLAGVGAQAVVDPQSLSTPTGVSMALGFAGLGAGITGWRAANPNPVLDGMLVKSPGHNFPQPGQTVTPDQARNIYAQMIGKIQDPPKQFWDRLKDTAHSFDRKVFSGKSALKHVGDQTSGKGISLEDRANLLSGSSAISHETIYGVPMVIDDATGTWQKGNVRGISDVFNLIPPEQRGEFKGYLLARHRLDAGVVEKIKDGYKHPDATGDLARLSTTAAPEHFKLAAQIFDGANTVNLDNSFKAGLIKENDYNWLKKNYPSYVSNSRNFALSDNPAPFRARTTGSSKGGFVDPIEAYMSSTEQTVNRARTNQFYNMMADAYAADKDGVGHAFSFEDAPVQVSKADIASIIANAKKDGVAMTDIVAESLARLKKVGDIDPSTGSVSFMREGRLMTAKLNKELAEGLSVLRPDPTINKLAGIIKPVEKVPRKLTSLFLDLSGVGPYKDTFLAYINAPREAGLNPLQIISNPVKGYKELTKKGDYFYEMLGEGGKLSGRFVGQDADAASKTAKMVADYATQNNIKFAISHPIRLLEEFTTNLSNSTRMGMYMRLRDNGMTASQAAVEARRVLADPFQSGAAASIKGLSAASSFANTGLQEIRNIARVAAKDPSRVALKGLISVGIPSAISWALSEVNNDQQIREMRNAPGGSMFDYWRFGDQVIATPRPAWAIGQVFGTGMDTFLDATLKDEDSKKRWAQGFLNQISVNVVPLSIQQAYMAKSGEQFMGPLSQSVGLTPAAQEGLDPTMMGNSRTSEFAKTVAETLKMNPFKVDAALKGLLTTDGYKIERLLERAVGSGYDKDSGDPEITASDIPLIQRYFKSYPTTNVASLRKFYDSYTNYTEVAKTVQFLENQGRIDDLRRYVEDHREEIGLAPAYAEIGKELASMRKMNEFIALMPEEAMSQKLKKERIDNITLDMISLARTFNENVSNKK